jgi:hypothetical protein
VKDFQANIGKVKHRVAKRKVAEARCGNELTLTVRDLNAGEDIHNVEVRAITALGQGPPSELIPSVQTRGTAQCVHCVSNC